MSITLDGTSYWVRSGNLYRVSDSPRGTILTWVTIGDNDATQMYLFSHRDTLTLERDASNKIVVTGKNVPFGSAVLQLTSDTSYTNGSTWYGILASWDLSEGDGYLYINRSADLASSTIVDTNVDLTANPTVFGAKFDETLGWVGNVHEFHLWDEFLDISDEDEIIKLISSDGLTDYTNPGPTSGTPKPVGIQGFGPPFYKPPLISFYGAFTGNKGTGGDFSQTGSFGWVDLEDDISTYRQSSTPRARPGQRSFDSERTGWTWARHETFVERREGLSDMGKRLGIPERKDRTRDERPGHEQNFTRLIRGDEEDSEDRR